MDSPFYFEATKYWSDGDERAHFEWLSRIDCIRNVKGGGTRVFLDIDSAAVSSDDLRELAAVYRRYKGDKAQLAGLSVVSLEGSVG